MSKRPKTTYQPPLPSFSEGLTDEDQQTITTLLEIKPDLPREKIAQIYLQCGKNQESTINKLLTMEDEPQPIEDKKQSEPLEPQEPKEEPPMIAHRVSSDQPQEEIRKSNAVFKDSDDEEPMLIEEPIVTMDPQFLINDSDDDKPRKKR